MSDNLCFALCGLGPVVKAYSVVATRKHIPSAADAVEGDVPEFLEFALHVRAKLSNLFGSCLLTEHGRVPLCLDVSGMTDPHCFHAHFLLFPGAPDIEATACSYFARTECATSLREALAVACQYDEYFLLSAHPDRFVVMTRPGRIIRQFARLLVAEAFGRSELANWRRLSQYEEAAQTARELRNQFNQWGRQ